MTNPKSPRYVAKHTNGAWQVFDTVYYGTVGSGLTEKAAQARADELNARKSGPAPAKGARR